MKNIYILIMLLLIAGPVLPQSDDLGDTSSNDPVAIAKDVMAKTPAFWTWTGYSATVAVYKVGAGVAMGGGGYILLESPKIAADLVLGGFIKLGTDIGKDVILGIVEKSVRTPRIVCKNISKLTIKEGLQDYKIAYDIAQKYNKSKNITEEEAKIFLKARWGLFKLAAARTLANEAEKQNYTITESVAKKTVEDVVGKFDESYQSSIGIRNTMPVAEAAFFIRDIVSILEAKKVGLMNYPPYLTFLKQMDAINERAIHEAILMGELKERSNPQSPIGNVDFKSEECIRIGEQVWMSKNLNVDHYQNGDPIPEVRESDEWLELKTGAWCYYNNDPKTEGKIGKLYNWYAVVDPRGLAPKGWHIPSVADYEFLCRTINFDGTALKALGEGGYPGFGTNKSGFNVFMSGTRIIDGRFVDKPRTYFWTSDDTLQEWTAYCLSLQNSTSQIEFPMKIPKQNGCYVRCLQNTSKAIRDNATTPDYYGPVDKTPWPIKTVRPDYPEIARKSGIEGTVWVKILVDKEGTVKKAVVLKSAAEVFNDPAIKAAMQMKFSPPTLNNRPIDVCLNYPFRFKRDESFSSTQPHPSVSYTLPVYSTATGQKTNDNHIQLSTNSYCLNQRENNRSIQLIIHGKIISINLHYFLRNGLYKPAGIVVINDDTGEEIFNKENSIEKFEESVIIPVANANSITIKPTSSLGDYAIIYNDSRVTYLK